MSCILPRVNRLLPGDSQLVWLGLALAHRQVNCELCAMGGKIVNSKNNRRIIKTYGVSAEIFYYIKST